MATHNWCHNPKCHTYKTTDRVRGSGNNKVLRTRKVKIHNYQDAYYYQGWENHFCRVACFFQFVKLHIDRIVALAPVKEPSETPIKVEKEKVETRRFDWSRNEYYNDTTTRTVIVGERND
jgi:hypothetical protein